AGLHLNRFYLQAMSWPRLEAPAVSQLAAAAAALQRLSPRYRDLGGPRITQVTADMTYVEAHAVIEALVADGYRLRSADVKTIYSTDMSDRRGFWRHFASDPHSSAIAAAAY